MGLQGKRTVESPSSSLPPNTLEKIYATFCSVSESVLVHNPQRKAPITSNNFKCDVWKTFELYIKIKTSLNIMQKQNTCTISRIIFLKLQTASRKST